VTERQTRIFCPRALGDDERYTLTGDQHRHIARVLRLKVGAALTLFDGRGGEYAAALEEVHRGQSVVRIREHRNVENESPIPVRLAQGVSRGERTDYAIQKAVELGVTSIVPLLTRRGVVQLDADRAEKRLEHWKGIIVHACQQCGRNRIPELLSVITLEGWLADYECGGVDIVMDPRADSHIGDLDYDAGLVTLLVGPEGGLDAEEVDAACAAGFRGITLGPRTLRTETAAIAGVTAIQLKWGDLDAE